MDFVKELIDYSKWEGRFEDKDGAYVGMGASSYSETMVNYFKSLQKQEKEELIAVIINGAIGKIDALLEYVSAIYDLIFTFILSGFSDYFMKYISLLEEEFNNEKNILLWLEAKDYDIVLNGFDYKKDWHYPLCLSVSICSLGSKNINKSYKRLMKKAKSEDFREALKRNKENKIYKDF
jgi:hypothetical protein